MRGGAAGWGLIILFLMNFLAVFGLETAMQTLMPGSEAVVPAVPFQSEMASCPLDLSEELFAGVKKACVAGELVRTRCCPVLAAWFYAAHARAALKTLSSPVSVDLPVLPEDSQRCVDNLRGALDSRGIHLPQPNETCDPILCFCGIRLHQISSLSCPAAFNVTGPHGNVTATPAVRALEANCRAPTQAGCTECLKAVHKINGMAEMEEEASDRTSRMYSRDCELAGLTWLLAKNKTAYIPTVSAVFRALMYSGISPPYAVCSPGHEKMPLAVDSSQLDESAAYIKRPCRAVLVAFSIASLFV